MGMPLRRSPGDGGRGKPLPYDTPLASVQGRTYAFVQTPPPYPGTVPGGFHPTDNFFRLGGASPGGNEIYD